MSMSSLMQQYEREKIRLDETVRELASSSFNEKILNQEKEEIAKQNIKLQKALKAERDLFASSKMALEQQIEAMKHKISSIEYGCAK